MAPEMLRNEGYDYLADVWSIGVLAATSPTVELLWLLYYCIYIYINM